MFCLTSSMHMQSWLYLPSFATRQMCPSGLQTNTSLALALIDVQAAWHQNNVLILYLSGGQEDLPLFRAALVLINHPCAYNSLDGIDPSVIPARLISAQKPNDNKFFATR